MVVVEVDLKKDGSPLLTCLLMVVVVMSSSNRSWCTSSNATSLRSSSLGLTVGGGFSDYEKCVMFLN